MYCHVSLNRLNQCQKPWTIVRRFDSTIYMLYIIIMWLCLRRPELIAVMTAIGNKASKSLMEAVKPKNQPIHSTPWYELLTPSPPHTVTPSNCNHVSPPHTFTPSHPHTITPSHPHTITGKRGRSLSKRSTLIKSFLQSCREMIKLLLR